MSAHIPNQSEIDLANKQDQFAQFICDLDADGILDMREFLATIGGGVATIESTGKGMFKLTGMIPLRPITEI